MLSVLAIIIGVVVAYGAIGFLATIALLQEHSFANQAAFASILERVYSFAVVLPWWHVVLVPTIGGFVIGLFLKYVMPGGQAQGVAQAIEAGRCVAVTSASTAVSVPRRSVPRHWDLVARPGAKVR